MTTWTLIVVTQLLGVQITSSYPGFASKAACKAFSLYLDGARCIRQ